MSGTLTDRTRVLLSFGAREGGFEFAMQLRLDIYRKFGIDPASDGAFCYLDAESLRRDPKTRYERDQAFDKNFMTNPDWDGNYRAAMGRCRTMILLITAQWLRSENCWHELDMLIATAKTSNLKTIVVVWPDADAILNQGTWPDKTGDTRGRVGFWARIFELRSKVIIRVSGAGGAGEGAVTRAGVTSGINQFDYGCTKAECGMILGQIDR